MNYSPAKTTILFFLGLMSAGTVLLSLPAAHNFGEFSFIADLFTSVSAVCVTGLSVVNIWDYYSINIWKDSHFAFGVAWRYGIYVYFNCRRFAAW